VPLLIILLFGIWFKYENFANALENPNVGENSLFQFEVFKYVEGLLYMYDGSHWLQSLKLF